MEPQAEKTPHVTPEQYLVRSPFLAWRVIEGEAVIISPQERELHSLNEVGTTIWRLADGSRTLRQIALELSQTYEITPEEVLPDVLAFAQEMVEKGVAFLFDHPTSEDEVEERGMN
ncbi:MAG: PqqD family protein [bacterium]|nr:PqqD family protein [bacterium]MCS7310530.1 PqqD family protein [Armatimonadota bacterium]MDW8104894.1 PqqD family protein [Armatimonadota bacterium]